MGEVYQYGGVLTLALMMLAFGLLAGNYPTDVIPKPTLDSPNAIAFVFNAVTAWAGALLLSALFVGLMSALAWTMRKQ